MEKVIIFGGTGFIGLSLADHLHNNGFTPILVARNKPKNSVPHQFVKWDGSTLGDWKNVLNQAKAIVNLAGKSVDCIKSPENIDVILRSRIDTTQIIGKALLEIDNPPAVWVQMSTAHIYGDPPLKVCGEDDATGYGLAPFVGKEWEKAFLTALPDNMRGVRLRTSFVIGKNGGALTSLKRIVKLGLGGTVAGGRQGMSWIHEYDMNEIIHRAIISDRYQGIFIASAPNPVSNKEFMKTLRGKMGIPIGLPAPAFLTRIGATLLFKTDPELAIYGRYVRSKRLEQMNFDFKFPTLDLALEDLI